MASLYTKDKLKAILVNHNIPIPKDAKKGVYLDLYREHVEANEHGEFSSDDEVSTILHSPTKRNKVRLSPSIGRLSFRKHLYDPKSTTDRVGLY